MMPLVGRVHRQGRGPLVGRVCRPLVGRVRRPLVGRVRRPLVGGFVEREIYWRGLEREMERPGEGAGLEPLERSRCG